MHFQGMYLLLQNEQSQIDNTNYQVKNWENICAILILDNKQYIPIKSSDYFQDSFFHLFKGNIFHIWVGGSSWFRSWGSEIIHYFLQFENEIAFKLRPLNPAWNTRIRDIQVSPKATGNQHNFVFAKQHSCWYASPNINEASNALFFFLNLRHSNYLNNYSRTTLHKSIAINNRVGHLLKGPMYPYNSNLNVKYTFTSDPTGEPSENFRWQKRGKPNKREGKPYSNST